MELLVDDELRRLARQIVEENLSREQWRKIEADDWFQTDHYEGGFDATEDAFCFSFYPTAGPELWFQFSLDEALEIAEGRLTSVTARPAG